MQIDHESIRQLVMALVVGYVIFRIFWPMQASDGRVSRSLTGLYCTTAVIFMVVIMDTVHDRPEAASSTSTLSSTKKGTKVVKRSRGRSKAVLPSKSRSVLKEKYYVLFAMWLGFAFLYLFGHKDKQMAELGIRVMTAIRGKFNPMPDRDMIDQLFVSVVGEKPDAEAREWLLRAVLAKQGVASSVQINQEVVTKEEPVNSLMQPEEEEN